ncbi:SDR family oxidoreductase [Flavobacterium soyangense]|uniref:SDR family oxidoreductase n=1 Tax=Flavobacterium soyangense TaxID=2023265 RepID=A0A930XVD5_9FLAO|nr:SDR family oxidoreductase [Flavobacterium soyangense]MBF2709530.1 SDR family oxidoreductase [Flavobacterium soyangense]
MKNVVITGTSNGLGYLTALTLAEKGFKVWATMRDPLGKNLSKKEEFENIVKRENLNIKVIALDVTDDNSVKFAFEKILLEDKKIDILINNAGSMFVGITEAYSIEQAKNQFETNFFGTLRTIKAATPFMREAKDGLIINISSLAGRLAFPYFGIYSASKHALEAYSESLGYELAPFGVEVTIIEPGAFGTGLLFSGPKEADTNVFNEYGEHKDVPQKMLENFKGFFETKDALDPQLVADTIFKLIETKKGHREKRIVSGFDYGVIEYNEKVAPIQEFLVKDILQMSHLLKVNLN